MKSWSGKRLWAITLCMVFLITFVILPAYADEYDDLKKHQDNAEKYEDLKEKAEKDKNTYNKQIKDLDPQINQKESDLNKLDDQLDQSKKQLSNIESQLNSSEKELSLKNEILKNRLKSMYQDGNTGYWEIILNSNNFTEMVNRFEFLKKIAERDTKLLEEIKEEKKKIEVKRDEQKKAKEAIESNMAKITKDKNDLASIKSTKEQLMKKAEKDAATYDKLVDEENQKAQEISNILRQRTGTNPYVGGVMLWPVPGYGPANITSPYGWRTHPIFGTTKFHSGIDIGVPMYTTVVAPQSGTVIFAVYGWNGGYGNYMVIDHGGGITTAYAHLSSFSVSVGQSVTKGQPIAKVGSTGNSTGPHLHFEVRVNGNLQNPKGWVY